jgi:hypothetical protein
MYTGPGGYKRNWPPIHILIKELEKRGLNTYANTLRKFGF